MSTSYIKKKQLKTEPILLKIIVNYHEIIILFVIAT